MPDDGRLNSKPKNLGRHALCAKTATSQAMGVLRQVFGVQRLAKCRVFVISPSDGEKHVIHSNPR